jgi:hypothetical protein
MTSDIGTIQIASYRTSGKNLTPRQRMEILTLGIFFFSFYAVNYAYISLVNYINSGGGGGGVSWCEHSNLNRSSNHFWCVCTSMLRAVRFEPRLLQMRMSRAFVRS